MSRKRERIWFVVTIVLAVAFGMVCISWVGECRRNNSVEGEIPMITLPTGQAVIYSVHESFPLKYGSGSYSRVIVSYPESKSAQVIFKGRGVISNISPSPDGKTIAFTFKRPMPASADEGYDRPGEPLWLISLEDGRTVNISSLDTRARLVSKPPAFSQDGKLLAFSSEDGSLSQTIRLFVYDIDEGSLVTPSAFNQMTLEDNPPHFLQGDKEIACGVKIFMSAGFGDFKRQLISYDYKADTYRVIADFEKEDNRIGVPIPGPEGKYIYFNCSKSGVNHTIVKRVLIEGGEPEKVFEEEYVLYLVDFIPEGNKALMSYHVQAYGDNKRYVCIGDLETGGTQLITGDDEDISIYSEAAYETGLRYVSPDGRMILTYFHDLKYDFRDVLVMDAEGGNRVNVSNTALFDEDIATWIVIPDGLEIPPGGYEVL